MQSIWVDQSACLHCIWSKKSSPLKSCGAMLYLFQPIRSVSKSHMFRTTKLLVWNQLTGAALLLASSVDFLKTLSCHLLLHRPVNLKRHEKIGRNILLLNWKSWASSTMTSQMRKKLIDWRKMFLNLEIPDRRINSFLSRPQPLFPPILKRKGKHRMTTLSTGK